MGSNVYSYSSLTRLWLSVSMKLPRLRVLRLRPKYDFFWEVLSVLPTLPPMQKKMVQRKKQAQVAQVKAMALVPMFEV